MAENIQVVLTISVSAGPKLSAPQTVTVDAYDKIQVAIAKGDDATPTTKTVAVQPSGSAGPVQFLFINTDQFSTADPDKKLTYKVNAGTEVLELDAPLLLVGDGAISLLGAVPQSLTFTNTLGVAANIEILVGRNV